MIISFEIDEFQSELNSGIIVGKGTRHSNYPKPAHEAARLAGISCEDFGRANTVHIYDHNTWITEYDNDGEFKELKSDTVFGLCLGRSEWVSDSLEELERILGGWIELEIVEIK